MVTKKNAISVTPIEDPARISDLKELLDIFMNDNRQAWDMQTDGSYIQRHPGPDESERSSHQQLMQKAIKGVS